MADELKTVKDSLVASLFALSKAANEVSKNIIGLNNLVDTSVSSSSSSSATSSLSNSRRLKKKNDIEAYDVVEDVPHDELLAPHVIEKKVRKRKAIKDPNAPKKPLTSYILFFNSLRSQVAEKNTGMSQTEIAKLISQQWKEMPDEEKAYWRGLYEKEKVRYDSEMSKYNASKLPDLTDIDHGNIDIDDIIIPELDMDNHGGLDQDEPKKKKSKKSKKVKKDE